MITKLSIRHFKAIASATVPLGPITVLVGPNDSGKSTILQALMALARSGDPGQLSAEKVLDCSPSVAATHHDVSSDGDSPDIELDIEGVTGLGPQNEGKYRYRYMMSFSPRQNVLAGELIDWEGTQMASAKLGGPRTIYLGKRTEGWTGAPSMLSTLANETSSSQSPQFRSIIESVASEVHSTLLRLDARAIARPAVLGAPLLPDGSGLVGIVDELLTSGVGDEQVGRVNEAIRKLSPHVKNVAARRHAATRGKELHFALRNGAVIPACQTSDGIVLATALVVISLGPGVRRLLIEEPENGLHPRQLKIIVDTIRLIAGQGIQVVLTTHSPLLVNFFSADEVLLVTRDHTGVRVQPMSEARGLDDLASEMALGELWYNVGDTNLARPA